MAGLVGSASVHGPWTLVSVRPHYTVADITCHTHSPVVFLSQAVIPGLRSMAEVQSSEAVERLPACLMY